MFVVLLLLGVVLMLDEECVSGALVTLESLSLPQAENASAAARMDADAVIFFRMLMFSPNRNFGEIPHFYDAANIHF